MSTIDDLKAKVQRLTDQLNSATESLHAAMISEHHVKAGDVGVSGGSVVMVTRVVVRYERIRLYGRKKTKHGWHAVECELYRGFTPTVEQE